MKKVQRMDINTMPINVMNAVSLGNLEKDITIMESDVLHVMENLCM